MAGILYLCLSGVKPDIFPVLLLIMMTDGFMRRRTSQRYLRLQRLDDPVLVMLRRILYSDSPFVDRKNRLKMIHRFGMSFFLLNALMHPGVRLNCPINLFFLHAIDRVKRGFLSPPQQIQSALCMLSNPFFQTPPFQLSFSIEGFADRDDQLRLNLMKFLLLSIPSDFAGLPEFLALVRHLMLTDNPLWNNLLDVYICYSLDQQKMDEDEECLPAAMHELSAALESSIQSQVFDDFARLFQPDSVPNDCESFLEVIERFLSCMIENLSILPGIFVESDMIHFSMRDHKLSQEGIEFSEEIMRKLQWIHSLNIPEVLMELLHDSNFNDSNECLFYRGFELLLKLFKMIQESNGVIFTYIHACILVQTSAESDERRRIMACRNLFTVVFDVNDESPESKRYDTCICGVYSFLKLEDRDNLEQFLVECLLEPNFFQIVEALLKCFDEYDLEENAVDFMNNPGFFRIVEIFRKFIHERKSTWFRV